VIDILQDILVAIWQVTSEMAAYLLLGFLVAGLLSVFISPVWLERHLGRRNMASVFKASLFGVPLPLCSCGVIPVAASMRQHGASRAATTAFLLSTPQTGVDSIMVTYTLLGPLFAVFRPVAALLTGILGGALVQAFDPPAKASESAANPFAQVSPSAQQARPRGLVAKTRATLHYGLVTLPGDIAKPLLIGVVIAGVLSALIPENFLEAYLGAGAGSIALMMLVGIPLYVCATASVPLAASFIFLGATPGAALAFLVAGPATNAAALTTISRVLGRRTAVIFLLTVAASAFGGGLLMDWLLPRAAEAIPALSGPSHHHEGPGWFAHLSAVALIVVMIRSWLLVGKPTGTGQSQMEKGKENATMSETSESLELNVTGMNCSHCTGSVDRALRELSGVTEVQVSLDQERAVVQGKGLDAQAMITAIEGLGFKASRR
jgi:uncharacterized membrane protein YraQ (UPF0718 family)/copper chaperone CopZ